MRSFTAVVFTCVMAQALGGLMPAFVDSDTGEVLVRVPRQLALDEDQYVNRRMAVEQAQFEKRQLAQINGDDDDQFVAADTSYGHPAPHPIGRSKTQVYRGPSKPGKSPYDSFAAWGFYNTQPADAPPHHG